MNISDIYTDYSNANIAKVWRNYTYDMMLPSGIAKYVARTKYAFPGGYEIYAVTDDGGILCFNCCRTEFSLIAHSDPSDGWHVSAATSTAMDESWVTCDHCHKDIHIMCEDCFEQYDTVAELHNHTCKPYMDKRAR